MANKISLTSENTKYLIDAFTHFFPEDTIYAADKPYVSGEFNWKNRADFIDFINRLTGVLIKSERDLGNIKKAQLAVEKLTSDDTNKEKTVESNMPDKEARELQEAERQKRESELKESQEKAQKTVEKTIERKVQIQAAVSKTAQMPVPPKEEQVDILNNLKDKVVYAIPAAPPPKINFTQAESKLIDIAKNDAQLFSEKLSELIVQKNPDIPQETLEPLSKIIAVDTTRSLINPAEKPIPPGVFVTISKPSDQIPSLNPTASQELNKTIAVFSTFSESQDDLYRTVLKRSLGENITNHVLGFQNQEYILSETPSDTGFVIKLDQLQENSFAFQEGRLYESINSPVDGTAKLFVESSIKDFALDKVKSISGEPALGGLSKFTNSKTFDSIAPFLGIQTNFTYAGTGFFGKTITTFFPEYAPLISNLGEKLGMNVGIKAISPVVTKTAEKAGAIAAGTTVGKAVAVVAAKTGLKAGITAAGQALGSFAPIIGNILAFIGTEIIGKIIKKIPWDKVKKYSSYIVGAVLGVGGLLIAGPVAGVAIGLGSFGLASIATGGSLGAIGAGIGRFFVSLGGLVAGSIAMPILVTLLVFPVIVAIILFIINSGAYVTPYYSERSIAPGVGGLVSNCLVSDETGSDITNEFASRIKNGVVNLLPNTVWGRRDGICITPTMIVVHWSAGANDDPDGNDKTYNTLIARNLSCHLATDTDDVYIMEKFFEKQVEFPACAGEWNTYSINNEVAGAYFTANPPPPNLDELEMAYDATCKAMGQYKIPWSQIYGHYQVPNSGKIDPGKEFLEEVFIPEIRRRCPNGN